MNHRSNQEPLKLKPIINYPREAQVEQSYLMTIDVQLAEPKISWNYPEEEYAISFVLNTQPYFSYEPLGGSEPTIVLHRFGGTYGPAKYQLTATNEEIESAKIRIMFMNGWGIPIASIELECAIRKETELSVKKEITIVRQSKKLKKQETPTEEFEATQKSVPDQDVAISTSEEQETNISLIEEQFKNEGFGVRRPATAFLSYNQQNASELGTLEQELKLRGVKPWHDIADLQKGYPVKEEIIDAIALQTDVLLIYLTPESLASSFTWEVEIPAALERHEQDHSFRIIPVLRGVTLSEVQRLCASRGLHSLKDFNFDILPDPQSDQAAFNEECKKIANQVLKAALQLRLHRMQTDDNYELWICLHTFKDCPALPYLDLDLNWYDLFLGRDRLPPQIEWHKMLFPALLDVKHALTELSISRRLHISLQSILPATFALGYIFPATTSFTLLLMNQEAEWSSRGSFPSSPPLHCVSYDRDGDSRVAIVEIAIAQPTAHAVAKTLPLLGLSYSHHLQFQLPEGPDHIFGIKNASQARAIAHQIGKELRRLCGKGVERIHLFAAVPATLAVLIGHHFNAICPITIYEYSLTDGTYKQAYTLLVESYLLSIAQSLLPSGVSVIRSHYQQEQALLQIICTPGISQADRARIKAAFREQVGDAYTLGISPILKSSVSQSKSQSDLQERLLSIAQSLLPPGVSVIRSHYQQEQALLQIICYPSISPEDRIRIKAAFRKQVGDAYTLGISQSV